MSIDPVTVTAPARRIAYVMTCAAIALAVAALALVACVVAAPGATGAWLAAAAGYPATAGPGLWQTVVLSALVLIYVAIWGRVFITARLVFQNLSRGLPAQAGDAARSLSRWLWLVLAWGILSQTLGSVAATWHFAEGERTLAISLGMTQVSIALAALIAGFMAHAFALGAELWRDHQEVV